MNRDLHDKISTGSDGGSDSDETLLESVFEKFSKNGKMGEKDFVRFIDELKGIVPDMRKVDAKNTKALFYYLAEVNEIDLASFKAWWGSPNKYELLSDTDKAALLLKAYRLYRRYSNSFGLVDEDRFQRLMEDLKMRGDIDDFEALDINGDGAIDFREFCRWLKWF